MIQSSKVERCRLGFTLVESIVVFSVVVILVGLLLPSVQAAREATRRLQCQNNLKLLSLALLNYEGVHGQFPNAWYETYDSFGAANENAAAWSWGSMILPHIEQSGIYGVLSPGETPLQDIFLRSDTTGRTILETPVPAFRCPSDSAPELNVARMFPRPSPRNTPIATSNYVGCNGNVNVRQDDKGRGVLRGSISGPGVKIFDIADGISNTIMLGERRWAYKSENNTHRFSEAAVVLGATRTQWQAQGRSDVAFSVRYGINYRGCDRTKARCGMSSSHAGGVQVAFADGSVHFLCQTINREVGLDLTDCPAVENEFFESVTNEADSVLEQLAVRNDGEVFRSDF